MEVRAPLQWPRGAQGARFRADVLLFVLIDPSGYVTEVVAPEGQDSAFVATATESIRGSRFSAPKRGGYRVWAAVCQPVRFRMG